MPLAIGATTTGQAIASAKRRSASPAPDQTAECPTRIIGRRAACSRRTGSAAVPGAANTCGARCAANGGSTTASSVAVAPTTSAGVVRCTGPGRSAIAVRSARRMIVATVLGCTAVAHLLIGLNSVAWSITWCVNVGSRLPSIWPEMAIIGMRSSQALATALTRLVEPGPSVDTATPGRPVSWP